MKNREHRFLIEKHPLLMMQKSCKFKHEVALTMNHYVSGNAYGLHAYKIKNRKILLFKESDPDDLFSLPVLDSHSWCARLYPLINVAVTISILTHHADAIRIQHFGACESYRRTTSSALPGSSARLISNPESVLLCRDLHHSAPTRSLSTLYHLSGLLVGSDGWFLFFFRFISS